MKSKRNKEKEVKKYNIRIIKTITQWHNQLCFVGLFS